MKRLGVILILFFMFTGALFVPSVQAQTQPPQQAGVLWNPFPTSDDVAAVLDNCAKNGTSAKECYIPNSNYISMDSITMSIMGTKSMAYQNGVVASLGKVIAGSYDNPPASFAYWIDDVGHDLGFAPKPAYAQGIGFSGFSALLPLWKVFRNIAYFLLAIVMIVVGFMVMLRKKIDPKTVVTVQNALPRIVLTLILITFSYAIVGLMIDIMYLLMYLAVSMFVSTGLLPEPGSLSTLLAGQKTTQAFYTQGSLLANIVQSIGTLNIFKLFGANINVLTTWIRSGSVGIAALALSGIVATGSLAVLGPVLAVGGGIALLAIPVLQLILALALVFLFLRLLVFFISAYIQIVIAMLFGPIQILFEAVPGTNSFASWFQNLIANLSVFPVGVIFFMLSAIFAKFADQTNPVWAPGLSAVVANTTAISSLISLGVLFAIPSIGGSIKEALKAKPFVGAGPEGIAGAFGQPVSVAMQLRQMIVAEKSMQAFSTLAGSKSKEEHKG